MIFWKRCIHTFAILLCICFLTVCVVGCRTNNEESPSSQSGSVTQDNKEQEKNSSYVDLQDSNSNDEKNSVDFYGEDIVIDMGDELS